MPEAIKNLLGVDPNDDRIRFLVGVDSDGSLRAFDVSLMQRIVEELERSNSLQEKLSSIKESIAFDITGTVLDFSWPDAKQVSAIYRNSGTENISLKIKTANLTTTFSDILLGPGSELPVGDHRGFKAFAPESAPTVLEVRKLD